METLVSTFSMNTLIIPNCIEALRRNVYIGLLFGCVLFLYSCGSSNRLREPEGDWVFLAQGHANHIRETDVFNIKSKEKFAALRIYVYDRAISIRSVKITLINGDMLTPQMDNRLNAGQSSRTIELAADGRQLEKVTIRYKSEGKLFTDKGLVQIGGLKPSRDMR
ncbi:hypothetical protein WBG78_04555 [Chryseolinea sp. T2]|uniref:hypothetical protein n=1 Tax=Chryseolinea sp. T2 TaxID=3129255 RepID=UPI003077F8F0